MPVPTGTPVVMLVGGTFDPPHRAHVAVPIEAREVLEREVGMDGRAWLVYVPAARSPHKSTGPCATDAQRRRMLELALDGSVRTGIWTDEIDRAGTSGGGPSYTADTVIRARRWLDANGLATCRMRLLIGADQALAFHRWHAPSVVLRLAAPAVVLRPPLANVEDLMEGLRKTGAWSEAELAAWRDRVVKTRVIEAAASDVRSVLAAGKLDGSMVRAVMDERVVRYIRETGLYVGSMPRGS